MKQYNLVIEEKLVKEVDKLIKEKGLYSSRSDFIRDAIRARLIEIKKVIMEEHIEEPPEEDEPMMHEFMEKMIKEHEEKKYAGVH